jgi:O-Antigen ligase
MILTIPFVFHKNCLIFFKSVPRLDLCILLSFLFFFFINIFFIHPQETLVMDLMSFGSSFVTFIYVWVLAQRLDFRLLMKTFFFYIILSSIVIIIEVMFGVNFYISNYLSFEKPVYERFACGFSSNSLHTGGLLLISFLASLYYRVVFDRTNFNSVKNYLFILLGIASIFFTLSRAAWVTFTLVTIAVSLLSLIFARWRILKYSVCYAIIFLVGLFALAQLPKNFYYHASYMQNRIAVNFNLPFAKHHVDNEFYDENIVYNGDVSHLKGMAGIKGVKSDLSGNLRVLSLQLSMKLIKEHFFTGVGLNNFPKLFNEEYKELILKNLDIYDRLFYANTHNTFLTYLVETGALVGLPLIIFILLLFVKLLYRSLKDERYLHIFAMFLVVVCWCQFIDVSRDKILYIILPICWSVLYRSPEELWEQDY